MIVNEYSAECAWFPETKSSAQVGETFLAAARRIRPFAQATGEWSLFDPKDPHGAGWALDDIAADFAPYVQKNAQANEEGDGFCLIGGLLLGDPAGSNGLKARNARSASLLVVDGAKWRNHAEFGIGSNDWPPVPSVVTYPLFRGVLLTMLDLWRPPWACVRCVGETGNTAADSGDPSFPYSYFQVPWMGYLDAPRAATVSVPPDLMTERTRDGGLLMIAAQTRPDFDDPTQLRAAKQIATTMMNHRPKGDPIF